VKKLFFFVALLSALFFVACGSEDTADSGDSADDSGDTTTDVGDTTTDAGDTNDDSVDTTTDEADTADSVGDDDTSDTADSVSDDDTENKVCTEDEGTMQLSSEICGSTQHGRLYEKCTGGFWVKTDICSCDPGDYPEVCGYYAQKMWFTANSKVATIDMAEGWTRTYFLVYQEQHHEKLNIIAKICSIKLGNSMSGTVNPQSPPQFAESLPLLPKVATLKKEADDSYSYFQDWSYEIRSIDPACILDPVAFQLPTDPNDACVQDWDNDTVPGMLIQVKGTMSGSTHIVEKSASLLNGTVTEGGVKIAGAVNWTDEQVVLSTSNPLLKDGAQNALKEPSTHFTGPANTWEQVLVDHKIDCQYVVDNAATLFTADPIELK
jgi:hypothetical protein